LKRSRLLSAAAVPGGGKNMMMRLLPFIFSALLPLLFPSGSSSSSSSVFVSAQISATIGPDDGVITYSEYEELFNDVGDAEPGSPAANFAACEGYPVAFAEEAFITLYGPGAEKPFNRRDGEIFIDILIETLNECTDPCVLIDDIEISEEELQKISVLALDFGDPVRGRNLGLWIEVDDEEYGDWDEDNMTHIAAPDQDHGVGGVVEDATSLSLPVPHDQQRQLQRRRKTKSRRIKKATMRGRKKKKSKRRMLQAGLDDEPLLPPDNTCGELLMEKLGETGNPAFECLFTRGAFVTSCDPRDVPLLTDDERLQEEKAAIRQKRRKKKQQQQQQQQQLQQQSVAAQGTSSRAADRQKRQKKKQQQQQQTVAAQGISSRAAVRNSDRYDEVLDAPRVGDRY